MGFVERSTLLVGCSFLPTLHVNFCNKKRMTVNVTVRSAWITSKPAQTRINIDESAWKLLNRGLVRSPVEGQLAGERARGDRHPCWQHSFFINMSFRPFIQLRMSLRRERRPQRNLTAGPQGCCCGGELSSMPTELMFPTAAPLVFCRRTVPHQLASGMTSSFGIGSRHLGLRCRHLSCKC